MGKGYARYTECRCIGGWKAMRLTVRHFTTSTEARLQCQYWISFGNRCPYQNEILKVKRKTHTRKRTGLSLTPFAASCSNCTSFMRKPTLFSYSEAHAGKVAKTTQLSLPRILLAATSYVPRLPWLQHRRERCCTAPFPLFRFPSKMPERE